MKQIKLLFTGICVSAVLVFASARVFSQPEATYEVSLQLLRNSTDVGAKENVPADLLSISRQLGSRFGYSNFRPAGTFLGRVSNSGIFSHKGLSNLLGQQSDYRLQSFLEWTVRNLSAAPTSKGPGFLIQEFSIGMRVPVVTGTSREPNSGKETPIFNYENIGLTISKLGVPENMPTLIGTLSLPGANDTIFVVMTIKSAER